MADWSRLVMCPECGAANPHDGSLCVKCGIGIQEALVKEETARQERIALLEKKRRPQGSRNNKPVDELTIADIKRSPVWEYDLANEKKHDETWVKPVKSLPVKDLSNRVVGIEARLACGEVVFCLLSTISLENVRQTQQFIGLTAFRADGVKFHLARYFDVDYDSHGPTALSKFLERGIDEVFPIVYDISQVATGLSEVVTGTIPASTLEKLTEKERMALIIG